MVNFLNRRKSIILFSTLTLLVVLGVRACRDQSTQGTLVLFFVVDQLPSELFERLAPVQREGFKRLTTEGIFLPKIRHDHAVTLTCPGHATLITGRFPSHTGIIANEWFEREARMERYCVRDLDGTVSPRSIRGNTLGDIIKSKDSTARVFAVSGKDRGAVTLGGHRADGVAWYDPTKGEFSTSKYYSTEKMRWLDRWKRDRVCNRYFGTPWTPTITDPHILSALSIGTVMLGTFAPSIPRMLGGMTISPNDDYFRDLYTSPFLDELTLDAAREIVSENHLGRGRSADLLGISLSAMDSVGHGFGPNSPEILDTFVRLDQFLGTFLDFIDHEVGSERVIVVLSSDHGVLPVPESGLAKVEGRVREHFDDEQCMHHAGLELQRQYGDIMPYPFYLNPAHPGEEARRKEEIERQLQILTSQCSHIQHLWSSTELAEPSASTTDPRIPFQHSFDPERSPNWLIQYTSGFLPERGTGTTHGSPYDYDSEVPLILSIPGVSGGRLDQRARSVDVSPTILRLLNIESPKDLDGRALSLP